MLSFGKKVVSVIVAASMLSAAGCAYKMENGNGNGTGGPPTSGPVKPEDNNIVFSDSAIIVAIEYDPVGKKLTYTAANALDKDLTYGSPFRILKMDFKTGKLIETEYDDELAFDMALWSLGAGKELVDAVDFNMIGKKMEKGSYYVVREYTAGDAEGAPVHIPMVNFDVDWDGTISARGINEKPATYEDLLEKAEVISGQNKISFTVRNTTDKELVYGLGFTIDKWNEDKNIWEQTTLTDDLAFIKIAVLLKPDETNTSEIDLSQIEMLIPGRFRISREYLKDGGGALVLHIYFISDGEGMLSYGRYPAE
ncbi:immunoglobulin-like domain-containing protein [Youngiibacter fragilis]|uniref:Bacterial Ig-like domain-containing protein n=1 Tax=Youngiibacter fragilis 232.1 TaxID=994573 RepID=V7I5T6_9CLOT|nr:immunoglobulin-like domain-containing protein [Youngiibacter fragilis]ETA81238.1 hypothetical protein T472_0207920 [Youngiibacter fragilis 232.1]